MLCAGRERKDIEALIDAAIVAGIRRIVALRGDTRTDATCENPVTDSCDLVDMLRQRDEFDEIMVAGYPNVHPEAEDAAADLQHLVRKTLAGATRIITQFCFEVDTLCAFRDRLVAAGVHQPISAGLLPIRNFDKMLKFAKRCQAPVPDSLHESFTHASPEDRQKLAQDLLNEMTWKLVCEGFDIHFYTLNSVGMVNRAWQAALAGQHLSVG